MREFLNTFKIPTLLGLAILLAGMGVGVFSVLRQQTLTTRASPDQTPVNITLSNIDDTHASVSFLTSASVPSFVAFGTDQPAETVLDDRDITTPVARTTHHFTLKKLLPATSYKISITTGKLVYPEILNFTTATPTALQNGYSTIQGAVMEGDQALEEGIAYLFITGAITQSAPILSFGNFVIPMNSLRDESLQQFTLEKNSTAKLKVVSTGKEAAATIKLSPGGGIVGPLKIGQNLDLTVPEEIATPPTDLTKYDLNDDGVINSADYGLVLRDFGPLRREASKNPQGKPADFNLDGVVDEKDLQMISKFVLKTTQ